MRKKPQQNSGGYNNQRQRPRFGGSNGGGDHRSSGHSGGGGNRPRRNYGAAREKYLAQARDALASGDRVLAENYLQHADHCYRMMVEEGAFRPQPQQQRPAGQPEDGSQPQHSGEHQGEGQENDFPENASQLPAFLTASYEQPQQQKAAEAPVQDWEERDAN